jgi:hypothetical protein
MGIEYVIGFYVVAYYAHYLSSLVHIKEWNNVAKFIVMHYVCVIITFISNVYVGLMFIIMVKERKWADKGKWILILLSHITYRLCVTFMAFCYMRTEAQLQSFIVKFLVSWVILSLIELSSTMVQTCVHTYMPLHE